MRQAFGWPRCRAVVASFGARPRDQHTPLGNAARPPIQLVLLLPAKEVPAAALLVRVLDGVAEQMMAESVLAVGWVEGRQIAEDRVLGAHSQDHGHHPAIQPQAEDSQKIALRQSTRHFPQKCLAAIGGDRPAFSGGGAPPGSVLFDQAVEQIGVGVPIDGEPQPAYTIARLEGAAKIALEKARAPFEEGLPIGARRQLTAGSILARFAECGERSGLGEVLPV